MINVYCFIAVPQREPQTEKLFYNIREVSEMFQVNPSLLRYWEKEFDILTPQRTKKGNRLFTADDIEQLKLIYHLVKERGLTIKGARQKIKDNREQTVDNREIVAMLHDIRQSLIDIRDSID